MSKNKSIIKSTVIVTAITFAIKFLGLIKQSVLAAYCGASDETDAFFIASGVISALSGMLFSAISISLLSVHTDKLIHQGREESNKLINETLRFFLPISIIISIVFFLGSHWIAKFLAPTYEGTQLDLLSYYIKLMSVVFVFACYYLTINVILETDKEFVPGRLYGFFQNVFLIIAASFFFAPMGMEALIWSFILAGLAECILVTACAGKRLKILLKKIPITDSNVKRLIKLSLPLIIGNALYEINDIVDKQISSSLGSGNASYLTYGSTINEIVTGVVVGSISIVLFSHFATWVSEGMNNKVQNSLNRTIEIVTFLILPIMAMCLFAGEDILRVFYSRGSFGEAEVTKTKPVVIGYTLGFVFSAIRVNMVKVFFAFQDTKRPLINGAISIVVNILCSILLSKLIGVGGISLATSIAMFVSISIMKFQLKKYLPGYRLIDAPLELLKLSIAFIVCSIPIYLTNIFCDMHPFIRLFITGIFCVSIYLCTLALLQSKIAKDLFSTITKKVLIR